MSSPGHLYPSAPPRWVSTQQGERIPSHASSNHAYQRPARFNYSFSANAGYTPDGNVTGISLLHVSGTGGAPTYGLIPQMPLTTLENVNLFDNLTYMQPRVVKDEAQVGYYKTQLQNGVTAEISASMHAGIMKYQFPEDADGKYVMVDISHFLPGVGKKEQQYSNGYLERSEDGAWYSGYTVFREGWAWGELHKTRKGLVVY